MQIFKTYFLTISGIFLITQSIAQIELINGKIGIGTTTPQVALDLKGNELMVSNLSDQIRLAINANGNVGIGTTIPSQKLEVSGSTILDADNASLLLKSGITNTEGKIKWLFDSENTEYAGIGVNYNNRATDGLLIQTPHYPITLDYRTSFNIRQSGNNVLNINESGNVGIGTSSPTNKLHVNSDGVNTTANFQSTDANANIGFTDNTTTALTGIGANGDQLRLYAGGSAKAYITSSGNVGIGTSSPDADLHISSTANVGIRLEDSAPSGGSFAGITYNHNTSNEGGVTLSIDPDQSATSSFCEVEIDGSDVMRINDSGRVGIGTTSPSAPLTIGNNVASGALDNDSEYQIMLYDGGSATTSYGLGIRSSTLVLNSANTLDIDIAGNPELRVTSAKTQFFGEVETSTHVVSGKGSGGVALTINDGKGNANITFNHLAGVPEQNGNAARIEVNTDGNSNSQIHFELQSGVTGGVNTNLENIFSLYDDSPARLWKYGDGNLTGSETYLLGVEADGDIVEVDPSGFGGGGGSSSRKWNFDMPLELRWHPQVFDTNEWLYPVYFNTSTYVTHKSWDAASYNGGYYDAFYHFSSSNYGRGWYFVEYQIVPFDCTCTIKPVVLRRSSYNNRNVEVEVFKVKNFSISGTATNESSIVEGYGSSVSMTTIAGSMNPFPTSASFTMSEGDLIHVRWKSTSGAST